ncbi:competence type IV pilus assembly protein ComGB [Virgibacillus senegalensis]|uniref:competence type IV pilus assembly protein ComGB n=1 Tax=Virgibacillus senegalensis TaxID=1499679 RepID=UPI00069EB8F9|nr:competence type IV pilus assembly protein ComGB [Virgibacillus senegalensis]
MVLLTKKLSIPIFNRNTLSAKDQLLLLQRLSRLIKSGYSLLDSLQFLEWDPKLKTASRTISNSLADGQSIDKAFEQAHFQQNIISHLYFARKNGDLESMLRQCSQTMESQLNQYHQFQKTARYPFLLLGIFAVLLYFIKTAVYPAFAQLIHSASGSTPAMTTYSVLFVNFLFTLFTCLLVTGILVVPIWLVARDRLSIELLIRILQKTPFLHGFKRMQTTFLFSMHLGALLKNTVPMKDALLIMKEQKHHRILAHYAAVVMENLNRGIHITTVLPNLPLFEAELTRIFLKNANAKELEHDLLIYSDFLTESMEDKWKKVISWVQPLVFFLLAGLIIFVYLSIMLPMFQLINSI